MKRLIALVILAPVLVLAYFPRIPISIDMMRPVDAYTLTIASGTTPGVVMYPYLDGTLVTNLSDWTATLYLYPPNVPAVRAVVSTNAGAGWFEFDMATADTATNGTMDSQVLLTGPLGQEIEWGRGEVIILKSAATETDDTLDLLSVFNWGAYSYVGTAPMLNVGTNGIMMNGVLLTAWDALPEGSETDPIYESEKSRYATGTPVYVESDPIWNAVSSTVFDAIADAAENGGITDAPSNGTQYARQDGAWAEVADSGPNLVAGSGIEFLDLGTNRVISATGSSSGEGGGTLLNKDSIALNGTYYLGDGITVNGSTIDVAAVDSGTTILGTPQHGQLIAYQGSPYDAPVYIQGVPQVGDGLHYDGTNWYYGPQSYSQSHDYGITIGDGVAVYEFTGVTNTYVVPLGVSNLLVKLWGSAGANGAYASRGGCGGYASGYLAVTPGETLSVVVGGGDGYSYRDGAFGGGGNAGSHAAVSAGGGGAYVLRSTNLLCAAGGGGGGCANYAGDAGGVIGSDGLGTYPGLGGSQTNGGAGYPDGSFMQGANGTSQGAGGGGGYYGGGAGGNHSNSSGGGGSSYIGWLQYAITYPVNFSYDEDYVAGVGEPSTLTYSHGGPGLVVIRW